MRKESRFNVYSLIDHIKHNRLFYGIFLLYVFFRAWLLVHIPTNYTHQVGPDGVKYLYFAAHNIFGFHPTMTDCSAGHYFIQIGDCNRPFVYPAFLALFHNQLTSIYIAQLTVSLIAWLVFARTAISFFNSQRLQYLTFILILLISCRLSYTVWDNKILTESLTLSSGLLVFSSLIWNLKNGFKLSSSIVMALFIIMFANLRDASAYLILMMAGMLIAYMLIKRKQPIQRSGLILTVVVSLLCFGFAHFTQSRGMRGGIVFSDLWVIRHLQENPSIKEYFKAHQAPPALFTAPPPAISITGHDFADEVHRVDILIHDNAGNFYNKDPSLRTWMANQGSKIYMDYLLTHPAYTFHPLTQLSFYLGWLGVPLILGMDYFGYGSQIPQSFIAQTYEHSIMPQISALSNLILLFLFVSWLILFIWHFKSLIKDGFTQFALITIFTSWLFALLVWVGEPMEILRHEFFAFALLELGIIVASFRAWAYILTASPFKLAWE